MSVRGTIRGIVLLAAVFAVVRFVALAFLDYSATARALVWMAPDSRDIERFPARAIAASYRPLPLPAPEVTSTALACLKVKDIPLESFLNSGDTTAFLVAHGEELLFEGYYHGTTRETVHSPYTLALPFVSTLVGLAVADGFVDPDDPVALHLPEFGVDDERLRAVTLRHLLTMASGLAYQRRDLPWSDDSIAYYSPDLRRTAMAVEYKQPPGEKLKFNLFNPLLIGMVLERATGMEVASYLEQRLWQPVGAEAAASWSLDSEDSGFERMHSGLNGRAVDFLKLGILYAQEGQIGRKQVLHPSFITEATRVETALDPALHYQFLWHVFEDRSSFAAYGDHGQILYVDPVADLAILRLGQSDDGLKSHEWFDLMDQIVGILSNG